jgi:prepilin-type N-terminal cleavage/methylation domain-containing protein
MKRMKDRFNGRKGFTLIELIIVVIIVGVLAAIALPQYSGFVERARTTEAVNAIGAIKTAEATVLLEGGNFLGAATTADVNTNLGIALDASKWTYVIANAVPTATFQVTASRVGLTSNNTIIFTWTNSTQTGAWSGNHPNRPK